MSTGSNDPLDAVKASWRRFLDTYEPLRPDLYRYCRHLTRSPWDAEDMAQETMTRAFASLGIMAEPPSQRLHPLREGTGSLLPLGQLRAREPGLGALVPREHRVSLPRAALVPVDQSLEEVDLRLVSSAGSGPGGSVCIRLFASSANDVLEPCLMALPSEARAPRRRRSAWLAQPR
jgi:RNA polymerase sigma-70 factor (ECF subfamily)